MWLSRLKMPVAMTIGSGITLGLFGVMQMLISTGPAGAGNSASNPTIRFGQVRIEPPVPPKIRVKPPKPEPPKPLPRPSKPAAANIDKPTPLHNPRQPGLDLAPGLGSGVGTSFCGHAAFACAEAGQDGDVVALARIQPIYPRRPTLMGIEGFVTVEFTITATGAVIDAKVIDAEPRRVFDRAALRAIVKWKFRPRIVNGQPVARRATQTLDFRLD